jgi:hypothetical protein
MEKIVVSRYRGLVEHLKNLGLIDDNTKVISFAKVSDVEDRHVLGVIPFWLAAKAGKVTEIQIRLPSEKRHTELTSEEIAFYALSPKTYVVREVEFDE